MIAAKIWWNFFRYSRIGRVKGRLDQMGNKAVVLLYVFVAGIVFFLVQGCTNKNDLLLESLRNRDYAVAKSLLLENQLDVNSRDKYGYTPLHLSEDEDITRILIAQGADPNVKGGGVDPDIKLIKKVDLGKVGAFDLNELKRGKDYSPLHTVESYNVAKILLENSADVNILANYKVTPLHRAAERKDNISLVKLLLDNGATVNARTNYNTTPLHEALFYAGENAGKVVRLLVDYGADVNAQDNLGHTPLHGIRGGNVELASYLVEHGADVTIPSTSGDLPICYAIGDNKIELMHFYIVRGKGILSRCSNDRSLLEYAEEEASSGTVEAVKRATVLILKEFQKSRQ